MIEIIIKAVLSALLSAFGRYLSDQQRLALERRTGRLEAEGEQAREGERVQGDLAEEAAKRVDPEDALAKLERGEA